MTANPSLSYQALQHALTNFQSTPRTNYTDYTLEDYARLLFDAYWDPSLKKTQELRSAIRRHQNEISRLESLQARNVSKQAKKQFANSIAYHNKQIESIYSNYPEYFI